MHAYVRSIYCHNKLLIRACKNKNYSTVYLSFLPEMCTVLCSRRKKTGPIWTHPQLGISRCQNQQFPSLFLLLLTSILVHSPSSFCALHFPFFPLFNFSHFLPPSLFPSLSLSPPLVPFSLPPYLFPSLSLTAF
jgi:hypothetical protein